MTDSISARYQFPYLAVAQAQKEITHNEALLMVDALLHPVVEAELNTPPTMTVGAQQGMCWLIGTSPNGVWLNKANHIAYWTGEGWRYFAPVEGMHIRNKSFEVDQMWSSGSWNTPGVIANPVGGTVIDIECRAILTDLLSHLRSMGDIGH